MRYNYWGVLPNGHIGPDDSVWNTHNNIFKPWYKKWINWNPKTIESNNSGSNPNSSTRHGNYYKFLKNPPDHNTFYFLFQGGFRS